MEQVHLDHSFVAWLLHKPRVSSGRVGTIRACPRTSSRLIVSRSFCCRRRCGSGCRTAISRGSFGRGGADGLVRVLCGLSPGRARPRGARPGDDGRAAALWVRAWGAVLAADRAGVCRGRLVPGHGGQPGARSHDDRAASGSATRRRLRGCSATCSSFALRLGWSRSGWSRSTGRGCTRMLVVTRTAKYEEIAQGDPRRRPTRSTVRRTSATVTGRAWMCCRRGFAPLLGARGGCGRRTGGSRSAAPQRRGRSQSRVLTG